MSKCVPAVKAGVINSRNLIKASQMSRLGSLDGKMFTSLCSLSSLSTANGTTTNDDEAASNTFFKVLYNLATAAEKAHNRWDPHKSCTSFDAFKISHNGFNVFLWQWLTNFPYKGTITAATGAYACIYTVLLIHGLKRFTHKRYTWFRRINSFQFCKQP